MLTWLRLVHPELPKLVKQQYGTELQSRTLATIKPEISQALDSLLEGLHISEDARVMRCAVSGEKKSKSFQQPNLQSSIRKRVCPLCKEAGRQSNHYLSKCSYLPMEDKKYMTRARQVLGADDQDVASQECDTALSESEFVNTVHRVQIRQSLP